MPKSEHDRHFDNACIEFEKETIKNAGLKFILVFIFSGILTTSDMNPLIFYSICGVSGIGIAILIIWYYIRVVRFKY